MLHLLSSIRRKLTALTFLTTGGTLLLVGVIFTIVEARSGRSALVRQLTTQAEIVGYNSAPALVFRDEKSAAETLGALQAEPQIRFAGIYAPDGTPFATYNRAGTAGVAAASNPVGPPAEGIRSGSDLLEVTRRIGPPGRPIGFVRLRADLAQLQRKTREYAGITGLVLLLSLVAAMVIGNALQKTFSRPVLDLVQTAKKVTTEKDYTVRATLLHHDEIGVLVEAFNDMLGEIQHRDGELVKTADTLEREASERKRAEAALRGSEERYRLLFEDNPQPMWVFDEETLAFLAVNGAASSHYGYSKEEFLAMTIRDIRPPGDVATLVETIASEPRGPRRSGTWRHRKKNGDLIEVEISSHPVAFDGRTAQLVLSMDVTERRHLEEQLRQSQKMDAIGQLAGGVAHDFNNLLTVILGNVDLFKSAAAGNAELTGPADEIREAAERAAALTRQLLAFSRRQILEPKVLDPNGVIVNLEKMLRRLISEDVKLIKVLDPAVGRFRADAGQVEQIIVNLAVNARDAMPGGGTLTIETANVELSEDYAKDHLNTRSGQHVMIAVTDSGGGMTPDVKLRIFEPFFTTKGPGKGTGLGLATVHGIVNQSGGTIWVYSEVGRGTTFKIYFPRVIADLDDTHSRAAAHRPTGGTETVLLVEDEPSVRSLARRILESKGYAVIETSGAREAIGAGEAHKGKIHLMLTDVVMPEMGGVDLASRISAVHPETRVLYMSGYTDDAIVRSGLVGEGIHFLQKPFTPAALAGKVRQVLDE